MINAPNDPGNEPDPDDRHGSCAECDPSLLDHLKCEAQGIKAQSDYNTAHLAELDDARKKYDGARHDYSEARKTARPTVKDLGTQLEHIIEQLKCLVDSTYKIELLDEAFAIIKERLHVCYPAEGCTFYDDCDFDEDRRCDEDDIAAKIADIDRRTQAAKKVFTDLIAEPAQIATRVTSLQAEVDAIKTGMASDSRTVDFKSLYAQALVAQWHQETIYRGFAHVNAYVDCLCRTLTCQLKGHAAIAHLKKRQAIQQCHADAETARCEHLRTSTAEEVIAEYLRLLDERRRHDDDDDQDHHRDRDRDRDRDHDRDHDRNRDHDRDRDRDWGRDPSRH